MRFLSDTGAEQSTEAQVDHGFLYHVSLQQNHSRNWVRVHFRSNNGFVILSAGPFHGLLTLFHYF